MIQLFHVTKEYPGEPPALSDVTLEVEKGEFVFLTGPSGAGKTTLLRLIFCAESPSSGQILLFGKNVARVAPGEVPFVRRNIGVIFQDFVRYDFILKENIGVSEIEHLDDVERIREAARRSKADELAGRLASGYDQMLGRRFDGGVELSGGEWQKVALGRAYLRAAQLLILDEPTAALDARAEYEVFLRFSELTAGRMAVLISHRFSTVRMANRILVLQGGELMDQGTHEELVARGGLYAELFSLQAAGYQ
jgi:ATP-binding cassette subfamily B protein